MKPVTPQSLRAAAIPAEVRAYLASIGAVGGRAGSIEAKRRAGALGGRAGKGGRKPRKVAPMP